MNECERYDFCKAGHKKPIITCLDIPEKLALIADCCGHYKWIVREKLICAAREQFDN